MKRLAILLFIFAAVFATFYSPLIAINEDLGNHIKTGEIIVKTLHIPATNILSYTFPDYPIINDSWLGEVYEYLVSYFFGLSGLVVVSSLIPVLGVTLLAWYAGKNGASPLAVLISFLILDGIYFNRADVRIEFLSHFLFILFIIALYEFRLHQRKFIFLLPLLMVLWVNLHVVFPIGIAIIGIFWVDTLYKWIKKKQTQQFFTLSFVLFVSILATLLNPYAVKGALSLFTFWHSFSYPLTELQSIFFFHAHNLVSSGIVLFELSLIAIGVLFFTRRRHMSLLNWLLFCSFACIGIITVRNFPFFRLAIFLPLAMQLQGAWELIQKHVPKKKKNIAMASLYIVLALLFLWEIQGVLANGFGNSVQDKGQYSVAFFMQNHLRGPIFNNVPIGSYLEYRLYPQEKVFADTKFEQTPPDFYTILYFPMQKNQKVFAQIESKYHFNVIFYNYTDPNPWAIQFVHDILQNKTWKLVYVDDYAMILVKDTQENQPLIKQFGISEDMLHIAHMEQTPPSLIHVVGFLERAGWTKAEILYLGRYLQLVPHNCPALARMLYLTQVSHDTSAQTAAYFQAYQSFCQ